MYIVALPKLLPRLSSRVSHGKTRAESNRTFRRDCRNLK